jgi:hypothetical protein
VTTATRRRSARTPSAVPAPPPAPLTPRSAEKQALTALIEAGVDKQVSRIVSDTGLRSGYIGCVALLHVGSSPQEVATALATLPGADVKVGEAFVAVYRKA